MCAVVINSKTHPIFFKITIALNFVVVVLLASSLIALNELLAETKIVQMNFGSFFWVHSSCFLVFYSFPDKQTDRQRQRQRQRRSVFDVVGKFVLQMLVVTDEDPSLESPEEVEDRISLSKRKELMKKFQWNHGRQYFQLLQYLEAMPHVV